MDNARWIVVLSVIFSMMIALTLLNRYAGLQEAKLTAVSQQPAEQSVRRTETSKPAVNRPSRREIPHFNQISFPRPAAHTLTID